MTGRTVYLNQTEELQLCDARAAQLRRHLMGRMLELEEDGARIPGPQDPFVPQAGPVYVSFASVDHGELSLLLERDYGVFTLRGPQGFVGFSVGRSTTFEDIDYAQGAVYEILCRNR